MIENQQVKILWDFQIQTDIVVMANQPDIVVDKHERTAVVVDVAIPSNRNIRKKEHKKLRNRAEGILEKMWSVNASSDASSDRGTGNCNPQAGLVAPADTRNNI